MKTLRFPNASTMACAALACSIIANSFAIAEEREWMSRQGGTVIATLDSISGDNIVLVTPDSRQINLRAADLSLADRQHLIEFAGADPSIIQGGDPGTPEKDVRLDPSTMNALPEKLALGSESGTAFDVFETPRFWIATSGRIRPNGLAETAERLWHGMAFQHMNFRSQWGDRRMLIIAVEDRDDHAALGNWVMQNAGERDQNAPGRIAAAWNHVSAMQIILPEEWVQQHNLLPRALVFNVTDRTRYRGAMGPFQINCISGFLLTNQMGDVSSTDAGGYFAIYTGHAYYKEILLGGRSETNQLTVVGSDDEISTRSGFEDGRSWARTLRTLVRRGNIELDLEDTLSWSAADLDPEKLVTIYAFGYYMQSDSKRLSSYSQMIRTIETSNQIPDPSEIARMFGFESVEDFNADWKEFVVSGNFR